MTRSRRGHLPLTYPKLRVFPHVFFVPRWSKVFFAPKRGMVVLHIVVIVIVVLLVLLGIRCRRVAPIANGQLGVQAQLISSSPSTGWDWEAIWTCWARCIEA